MIPRAVQELFNLIRADKAQRKTTVYASFLQIYKEKILDLLNSNTYAKAPHQFEGLRLRWRVNGSYSVDSLYNFECPSEEEVMGLFQHGLRNRVVGSHKLNNASSRSHTIFTLTLETVDPNKPDNLIVSKLQLVDLAGSER